MTGLQPKYSVLKQSFEVKHLESLKPSLIGRENTLKKNFKLTILDFQI